MKKSEEKLLLESTCTCTCTCCCLLLCFFTIDIFRQQFKTFDPNNFTLYLLFSFQNAWPVKRKAVYTLVLFYIYLFIFLTGWEHNLRTF